MISGGRDYIPSAADYERLMAILKNFAQDHGSIQIRIGDCPTGVDKEVTKWLKKNRKETVLIDGNKTPLFLRETSIYKADWSQYGKSAGPRRNRKMLQRPIYYGWPPNEFGGYEKANYLIAFPGGKGTQSAISIAEELNIPVIRIGIGE